MPYYLINCITVFLSISCSRQDKTSFSKSDTINTNKIEVIGSNYISAAFSFYKYFATTIKIYKKLILILNLRLKIALHV